MREGLWYIFSKRVTGIQTYDFSKMYGNALTLDIYSEKSLQPEEYIQEFWKELTIDYPQSRPVAKVREVEGEIVRYDKRKQQLLVLVERKEIGIGMNMLQVAIYVDKQKILLVKSGNDYSVKKLS